MSETGYVFTAPLTVCIDFKNPHACLAKDPTYALADEFGIDVEWLPFSVPPIIEPQPLRDDDDRGARHRKIRAAYFAKDLARYAQVRGVTLNSPYRDPEVEAAGMGLLWVTQVGQARTRAYLDKVFEAHWTQTADIGSVANIKSLLGEDADGFEAFCAGAGADQYRDLQAQLKSAGIANVPAYWIEESLYYGRQHLPMIRWILSGREGPGPI